jgi:flagellar hook protein FlgE
MARAEFADMYAARVRHAGANAVGIGVAGGGVAAVHPGQHHQSPTTRWTSRSTAPASSSCPTDGANPMPLYTRNGQFKVDREGYIVNNDGPKLLGYPADERRDPARHATCAATAHGRHRARRRPPRSR